MKQTLRLLLLVVAFLLPFASNAQTHYTLQVGTGTSTNNYVPDYTLYNYSYAQMLYTASEVGLDGTIDTLAFQVSSGGTTRFLTIYMAEVSATSLSDQVPAAAFQQVFSGNVAWENGWVILPLDNTFLYSDTGSLVIAVIDSTGSWVSSRSFFGTQMPETRSRYIYSDYDTYTLSTSMTNSTTFLPNILLGISSNSIYCAQPSNLTVYGITGDQATFSWHENGNASAYELLLSDTVVTDFSAVSGTTVYDTTYTAYGLGSNMLYYAYVRALCDGGSASGWTPMVSFRSACSGYTTIPYSTGFEDLSTGAVPTCWQQVATGFSSASTFPSAYVYSYNARNSSVYFEFESNSGQTEIVALPAMENLSSLMLSFYASCMNTNFVLQAGVMEDTTFVPVETLQLTPGSNNNWSGSYYPYTVYYGSYNGSGERMALRVTASGSYTLMLDDLVVDYLPTCPPPSGAAIDGTGNDWVSLHWRENGSASTWQVAYTGNGTTPDNNTTGITVYDTAYTLYGLSGDTSYTLYVRSDCGSEQSAWVEVGTARPGIYVMENTVDTLRTCGATLVDNGGPDGNYANSSNNTLVVFPASTDSTLRIWGTINTESNYDYVTIYDGVGTGSDPIFSGSGSATVGPFVSMSQAFTVQFTSDFSSVYAGFELHTACVYMSSCIAPFAFGVNSVLGDSVWLSWNDTAFNSQFEVAYGPVGFNPDDANASVVNVYDTSILLTGLTMGQTYEFYVRADCGLEQSMWVGPISATPGYSYTMSATGSDTLHVCGYTIYDNGGEEGDYSSSCNSTLVVYPSSPTQTLVLTGSGNVENSYDHLYIYDGVGTAGTQLYHGQGAFTMPAVTSEEGVVTIVFTSDVSVQRSGFEINVNCIPLPSCTRPGQLTFSSVGTQSADISWTERGSATAWVLEYDTVNFTPGNGSAGHSSIVYANPTTLTGLDSGQTFYVYVAAYCNPDTSEFVGSHFTTLAATPATLPYSCTFEAAGVNGWDLLNGTQSNHWMVGSGASNGGSRGLYITNDGTDNSYNTSSTSTVFATRTLFFDSVGEHVYSFDWRAYGESSFDYLRVALVPMSVTLTPGSLGSWGTSSLPSGAIALDGGSRLNQNGSWTSRNGTFDITTPGAYNLVFLWRNDGSGGTMPPAAIDNIMLGRITCQAATDLTVTRFTSDSVYLSWNARGEAGPWLLTYDTTSILVYDSSAAIGNLVAGTLYNFSISTLCGNDTAFAVSVQVTPGSWSMRPNQTDTLHMCGGIIYDDGGATGTYSNSQDSYVILQPDTPGNLISVSGTSYTESSWDYLRIYDGAGTNGTELWNDYGVSTNQTFGPIESLSGPITLYFHSDASVQYDGFAINVSCVNASCRILNLHLDTTLQQSGSQLALAWDDNGALFYEVEYGNSGFTQGTGATQTSSTNSIILGGLTANTTYDVYVRSICGGGDTGAWSRITLQTAMCDNATEIESWDATMAPTTSYFSPLGYSYYNYSYTQTIVDASRFGDLTGNITALAFSAASTDAGNYFNHMDVYLANVPDSVVPADMIVPDMNHTFVHVIVDADMSYSTTGWHVYPFDTAFVWDGHSNVLVAVNRQHGSWSSGGEFDAHTSSATTTRCFYSDYDPVDITDPYGDYDEYGNLVGDMIFYSCAEGCGRPAITSVTGSYQSVTLNWSGNGTTYQVAVKETAAGTWPAATTVSGNSYTFTGLRPATAYMVRVRQDCSAEGLGYSSWMNGTFTTDSLPCLAPTGLAVSDITNHEATFSWTPAGNETAWELHVWTSGGLDTMVTTQTTTKSLDSFASNVTYNAQVRALCGTDQSVEGEWSDMAQFTTVACPSVTGLQTTDIQPTSIAVSWTPVQMAQGYELEYGVAGTAPGSGTIVTVPATSYTITGLEPMQMYDIRVMALCGDNWYSEEAATLTAVQTPDLPDGYFAVTVTSNNPDWGTVAGGGVYPAGSEVTLSATPTDAALYRFVSWSDNVAENPRVITVNDNITLQALFAPINGIDAVEGVRFMLYPNPAKNSTTVSILGMSGKVRIAVLDVNGREVLGETVECSADCEKQMDIHGLSQGAYFVRITGEQGTIVRKLMVK